VAPGGDAWRSNAGKVTRLEWRATAWTGALPHGLVVGWAMSSCGGRGAALGRSAALVVEPVFYGGDGEGNGGIRAAALDVDGRLEVRHPLVVDEVVSLMGATYTFPHLLGGRCRVVADAERCWGAQPPSWRSRFLMEVMARVMAESAPLPLT